MPDEQWQNIARGEVNEKKLAAADGMVLGVRDIDINHDWMEDLRPYDGFDTLINNQALEWIKNQCSSSSNPEELQYIDLTLLNLDQRNVFEIIMEAVQRLSSIKKCVSLISSDIHTRCFNVM